MKSSKSNNTNNTFSILIAAIIFLLLGIANKSIAQEKADNDPYKTRPFHLSFITPLGTNGMESHKIINNVSINIFAGYSGGLKGVEFSGFASILNRDMEGARFSGFTNVTLGTSKGADFSGFVNYSGKQTEGAQFSGFANVIVSSAKGAQVTGFVNTCGGDIDGVQIAGFANYNGGGKNAQISGFTNTATKDLEGAQLAGFVNVASEKMTGFQLSGFFNLANKLDGIQIAPFNYVDSLEKGTPIGVISIVKNGYHGVSLSANETQFFNVALKTGTQAFYTFLTSGIGARNNMIIWNYGFGAGTIIPINDKNALSFEIQSSHMNEDEWHTNILNLHNKLTASANHKLSENITLIGGISWNVLVSDTTDDYGHTWESSVAPFSVFNKTYSGTNVKMYPGLSIGIQFN